MIKTQLTLWGKSKVKYKVGSYVEIVDFPSLFEDDQRSNLFRIESVSDDPILCIFTHYLLDDVFGYFYEHEIRQPLKLKLELLDEKI